MGSSRPGIELRRGDGLAELDLLRPLWDALHAHNAEISPSLGPATPPRSAADAWPKRRAKYELWLQDPDAFFLIAEVDGQPAGYAFVTVGPGYASWATGERLAELETLSVLPGQRGAGVGAALIEAVWERLAELGVEDMAITTAATNVDAQRFYERQGFEPHFIVYFGKRGEA